MAKIKHNNFLDTVDEVFTDAKNMGVLHLYTEGDELTGRHIHIKGRKLFHFGTTGYLGLEQDERLKDAAIDAIRKYGTQFPLSKSYISHPLYKSLEEKVQEIYGYPVIITKNSTLGHLGVIPGVVRDEDGVILDHQVHWSVQNAAQLLKPRGIPVEMIRHSRLDMLEDKIKELSTRCRKIWYMADGVYSMYGDCAPIPELLALSEKYPQLYLYFDDVHGMSWAGKNGAGYVMSKIRELPPNVVVFGTLSKTFGASGAICVCADLQMHTRIKTFGGPLTFSAQLEPASVGAAIASADIHLSPEIYTLQEQLSDRTTYFNYLLKQTDLPLVEENECPVFYIGTGMPITGYNFVNRLMDEGYYVNLGIYPAVPVKNTGVRITISRHNEKEDMKGLVEAMVRQYPKSLEDTHTTKNKVRAAFKMPFLQDQDAEKTLKPEGLHVQHERSIAKVSKEEWNNLLGKRSVFDWDGLEFLEQCFAGNEKPEHNASFHYFIIRDAAQKPVLATFLTVGLWKEDMLAPASVSIQLEEKRKTDPYYLTTQVAAMGSLFTEGQHYYLDQDHPQWQDALRVLLNIIDSQEGLRDTSMTVLRDMEENMALNEMLHKSGFVKIHMPESCIVQNLNWEDEEGYLATLSSRSRKHFRQDIKPFEKFFDVEIKASATEAEIDVYYELFENVRKRNFDLNTFAFPRGLFTRISQHPHWEFMVMYLKPEYDTRPGRVPVGVMFCYKNMGHTYVPSFIGMDYDFTQEFQIYRQMLYQTILRARALNFQKIDFGLSASFEKKKVGAEVIEKYAYVQAKDNFSMELMGVMQKK